jgi:hypothetical protein
LLTVVGWALFEVRNSSNGRPGFLGVVTRVPFDRSLAESALSEVGMEVIELVEVETVAVSELTNRRVRRSASRVAHQGGVAFGSFCSYPADEE